MKNQLNASLELLKPATTIQEPGILWDARVCSLNNLIRLSELSASASRLMILKERLGEIWHLAICTTKNGIKPTVLLFKL